MLYCTWYELNWFQRMDVLQFFACLSGRDDNSFVQKKISSPFKTKATPEKGVMASANQTPGGYKFVPLVASQQERASQHEPACFGLSSPWSFPSRSGIPLHTGVQPWIRYHMFLLTAILLLTTIQHTTCVQVHSVMIMLYNAMYIMLCINFYARALIRRTDGA